MFYDYYCNECGKRWEENHNMIDRDLPTKNACPHCNCHAVKRGLSAPPLSYNGGGLKSNISRAGSNWNDVLKKIHAGSGKQSKIETN